MGLNSEFPWQFRLAAFLRVPILMFIVVPLSFLMWVHRKWTSFRRARIVDVGTHEERADAIAQQVKRWHADGRKKTIRTSRPKWASMSTKLSSNKEVSHCIKMIQLDRILSVDKEAMTMTLEPGVTMGQITEHLLPMGMALEVQVEMESITIGGVALGFGLETNSHKSGFFQETVTAYEMVTSLGEVKKVTLESDPELFRALPWSHGTLGLTTALTVRLTKTLPYIKMRYIPTYNNNDLGAKMMELSQSENPPHFLEATIFSKDKAVIQCGMYASAEEAAGQTVNSVNYWFKPFYYKWVETFLEKGAATEYIPLQHYYHRFTRSIFWELEDMIPFSNHPVYRMLWGWMGAPEVSLLKLFQGPVIRKASVHAHVVQESILPVAQLAKGVELFQEWFDVYPLLAFPVRVYDRGDKSGFLNPKKRNLLPGKDYGIWVDLGAYGAPRAVKEGHMWDPKKNIREMEHWTREIGGWQATYTDLFCTEREFRMMFDHSLLDKCRGREDIRGNDAFPTVFAKIKPEAGLVDLTDIECAEKENGTTAR